LDDDRKNDEIVNSTVSKWSPDKYNDIGCMPIVNPKLDEIFGIITTHLKNISARLSP
jgi:hypothetical protein